jgi:hypothetical protein
MNSDLKKTEWTRYSMVGYLMHFHNIYGPWVREFAFGK